MDWWRRPHLHRPRRSFEIRWSISKAYTTKLVNMGYAKSFLRPVGIRILLLTFRYVLLYPKPSYQAHAHVARTICSLNTLRSRTDYISRDFISGPDAKNSTRSKEVSPTGKKWNVVEDILNIEQALERILITSTNSPNSTDSMARISTVFQVSTSGRSTSTNSRRPLKFEAVSTKSAKIRNGLKLAAIWDIAGRSCRLFPPH